jgi:hypothetical protein
MQRIILSSPLNMSDFTVIRKRLCFSKEACRVFATLIRLPGDFDLAEYEREIKLQSH